MEGYLAQRNRLLGLNRYYCPINPGRSGTDSSVSVGSAWQRPIHNYWPCRNRRTSSFGLYRSGALDGALSALSAWSFISGSASTKRWVVTGLSVPVKSLSITRHSIKPNVLFDKYLNEKRVGLDALRSIKLLPSAPNVRRDPCWPLQRQRVDCLLRIAWVTVRAHSQVFCQCAHACIVCEVN